MVASRAADPRLPRAKIINVGSLMALQASAFSAAYTASKHALLGLTRALSNQWSSKGININMIAVCLFLMGRLVSDSQESPVGQRRMYVLFTFHINI